MTNELPSSRVYNSSSNDPSDGQTKCARRTPFVNAIAEWPIFSKNWSTAGNDADTDFDAGVSFVVSLVSLLLLLLLLVCCWLFLLLVLVSIPKLVSNRFASDNRILIISLCLLLLLLLLLSSYVVALVVVGTSGLSQICAGSSNI